MAHYTITIKSLIDNNFNFGLSDYPIFDEIYRNTLNQKILNHYYENEIGFETANLFKFYLNNKMNEIMPYYNELYSIQKHLIDNNLLLNDVNLEESLTGSNTTQTATASQSSNSGTSDNKSIFQDTPQGSISTQNIDDQNVYATTVNIDHGATSNTINDTLNSSGNGTNSYVKTIIGNNGKNLNIEILNKIQNNLMNIDMMIINDLNELFMQIF